MAESKESPGRQKRRPLGHLARLHLRSSSRLFAYETHAHFRGTRGAFELWPQNHLSAREKGNVCPKHQSRPLFVLRARAAQKLPESCSKSAKSCPKSAKRPPFRPFCALSRHNRWLFALICGAFVLVCLLLQLGRTVRSSFTISNWPKLLQTSFQKPPLSSTCPLGDLIVSRCPRGQPELPVVSGCQTNACPPLSLILPPPAALPVQTASLSESADHCLQQQPVQSSPLAALCPPTVCPPTVCGPS